MKIHSQQNSIQRYDDNTTIYHTTCIDIFFIARTLGHIYILSHIHYSTGCRAPMCVEAAQFGFIRRRKTFGCIAL